MNDQVNTPIEDDTGKILPNEVLNVEVDTPSQGQSKIPVSIKYGLAGLLFVAFTVGTVVVMSFSQSEPVEESQVFDEASLSAIAGQQPAVVKPSRVIEKTQITPDLGTQDSNALIDQLNEKIHALETALNKSSSLVAKQHDVVARQGSSIKEVMSSLQQSRASITEYMGQVTDLKERFTSLEARVGQNSGHLQRIKTNTTRKRQALPAFQLLSIDQWGDQPSVVLELQNQTTVAAVGDTRAGWSIQSIDRPNCIGVVRQSDQAKARVCKRS